MAAKEDKVIQLIHVIKLEPICSNESREEEVLSCGLVGPAQVCCESDLAADTEHIPIPHFLWKTGATPLIFLRYLCFFIALISHVY